MTYIHVAEGCWIESEMHRGRLICALFVRTWHKPFQGGTSVVVFYCSCCLYLYFGSAIMLVTYFVNFR